MVERTDALPADQAMLFEQIVETQRAISAAALDPADVMRVVAEHAERITGAAGAAVELLEGDEMVYRAATGSASAHIGLRLDAATSLSGLCVREGIALQCDDTEVDPRVDRDACRRIGVRSMVVVPLIHRDGPVGAVKVLSPEPNRFGDRDAAALEIVAGFVATSLVHASAYAQRAERLRSLHAIDRAMLTAATVEDIASAAAGRLRVMVGASRAGVVAFDWRFETMRLIAVASQRGERIVDVVDDYDHELFPPDALTSGQVTLHRDLRASAATSDLARRLVAKGVRGYLVAPLCADGDLLGALALGFEHANPPGDETLTIASEVADVVAVAMRHTRMRNELQAVVNATLDGVVVVDSQRRMLAVNPAACKIFQRSQSELIGLTPASVLGHEPHDEGWREFLEAGHIETVIEMGVAGDRRKVELRATANAMPGEHLLIMRDVTERLRLEEHLMQAQKMEAVGQLAGGVAHDFNNLLTVISGCTMLAMEQVDDEGVRSDLQTVADAAKRATALTSQLLAFSRRQVLAPVLVDLAEEVSALVPMLSRIISEDIDIVIAGRPGGARARVDRNQLEQVIVNLVVNARDAMANGGTLTIETGDVCLDDEQARTVGAEPGEYVYVSITDTGTGIEPETLSHIFEPFFTTKPVGSGTGLGLATVHGIVQQSGGAIEVDSQVGTGTTFRVRFPVEAAAAALGDDAASGDQAAAPAPRTATVLVCEDESALRTLVERILSRYGYTVLSATDPAHAIELLDTNPEIDIVLTDVVMPGMSGPQLAQQLRSRRDGLKVLYMSGYSDDIVGRRLDFSSISGYVEKPFTADGLVAALQALIDA